MRIRSQLLVFIAASLVIGAVATFALVRAAAEEERTHAIQSRAQSMSNEVLGLLVLTLEYARDAEEDSAYQWYERHSTITITLAEQETSERLSPALTELRTTARTLPPLFSSLQGIARNDDPLSLRRKELLIELLLTNTQTMSAHAHQWYEEAAQAHTVNEQEFHMVAIGMPFAMLLLFTVLAAVIARRVLPPLKKLMEATAAIGSGDLSVRLSSTAADELGELSRRFDQMTAALAQSGDQVRRSEKQLRAITENVPVLIAYFDRNEVYRFANSPPVSPAGRDPAQLIGKTLAEHLGPESYAVVRDQVAKVLKGERCHFERDRVGPARDGHALIDYVPDIDTDGTVVGFYAMVADITKRKHAELAQRDSEQRIHDIINAIPAIVGYFDTEERCVYANDTALKSQGLPRSQMAGIPLRLALGDENYAQHEPHMRLALAGRRSRFEGRIPYKGGEAFFQAHLIPDTMPNGTARGFFLMSFDVTRLKVAEQRAQASEKLLRAITDNLPVLISYVDHAQRLQFANGTYRTWLGVDPQTVIGRYSWDVFGPKLYAMRQPQIERALRGERVEFEDESNVMGVRRNTTVCYIPDIGSNGTVQGIYTLTTDVTALKTVEHQLQALARFDTLTGLPNRLQFNEKLPEVLVRAERTGDGVALMFLDIDRFKSINDSLGHAAGDAVLKEFARRLAASVRVADIVARLAGDEFVIILENLGGQAQAQSIAAKIIATVRQPMDIKGQCLDVTTSIGVAYHDHLQPPTTAPKLLARADAALYHAKEAGRNTFRMAMVENALAHDPTANERQAAD